jgi:hypothetical protein
MKVTKLFLFVLALGVAATASAADRHPKKKSKAGSVLDEPTLQEVTIPMAKGELAAEVAADVAQRERANAPRTKVEIAASSWKPTRVTTGSRLSNTTDFSAKGIPAMDVSFISPVAGRTLHLQFGLGFLALERTGTLSSSGILVNETQNGYLTMVRLGLAYSPWLLLDDHLAPYVSALALPSMLITRASAFDDGVNDTGVPFELGLGATYRISKPLGLDVGVSQILGRVQDSDLKGFGVRAGLRIAI